VGGEREREGRLQAAESPLLQQLEALRQQRDQARSIAQCIARQTSSLAEELYRLRVAGGGGSQRPPGRRTSGGDPERTLLRGAGTRPAEEDRHEPAAAAPEAAPAASEALGGTGDHGGGHGEAGGVHRSRGYGGAGSSAQAQAGGAPVPREEEGEEANAPRPSVEVTSGWDVFDPDDQIENTIPTAFGGEGWDADMGDLSLDGLAAEEAAGAADSAAAGGGPAPELSPASPGDARGGRRGGSAVEAAGSEADVGFDLLRDLI